MLTSVGGVVYGRGTGSNVNAAREAAACLAIRAVSVDVIRHANM